ncbi:glucan endo-1 3-beta-glucosidase basic vacuolar isoform [Phtheirospermum japonicum]|uniref:Glucan endo-1 3-beta-glucosidase basic vacuolar isoform n=1 Tax=Phtheirospermum japonicum TaxID=374723 RepID=A0A830BX07_9LAMI|nr:glucan endo-1 3-beta-glucosidase basic vacuolar isoform [Phtheirospermum japonicum]
MRLYEPNHQILEALRGSNISLILGVANEDIPRIAKNYSLAQFWLQTNVVEFQYVDFRYIAVGNNINPLDNDTAKYAPHVVPAMQNMANAVAIARLYRSLHIRINVSTAIGQDLLSPFMAPTGSAFAWRVWPYIHPVLDFLGKYDYLLLANLHTYLPYMSNPKNVTLDYMLFTSPSKRSALLVL